MFLWEVSEKNNYVFFCARESIGYYNVKRLNVSKTYILFSKTKHRLEVETSELPFTSSEIHRYQFPARGGWDVVGIIYCLSVAYCNCFKFRESLQPSQLFKEFSKKNIRIEEVKRPSQPFTISKTRNEISRKKMC